MKNLNKVQLIGRLGKDPEVQRFDSGAVKASFSVATSDSYLNRDGVRQETTEWHNIVIWRRLAEVAEQYLRKGDLVFLEGKIKTRSWEDQNGIRKYMTEIEIRDMIMLGSKRDNSGGGQYGGGQQQQYNNSNARPQSVADPVAKQPTATTPPASQEEVDDLPF